MRALIPYRPPQGRDRPAAGVGPPPGPKGACKRVAVLCGGHSLRDDWPAHAARFDAVVAVNGAALAFPCDYAVTVAAGIVRCIFDRAHPNHRPRVALVSYQRSYMGGANRAGVRLIEIPTLGVNVKCYTFPRAIKFALSLCGPVELFGVDMNDRQDDVAGLRGDHGPARWEQECGVLRLVWDARIAAVFGRCNPARLEYVRGERSSWPG